jgi:hypothetical protein
MEGDIFAGFIRAPEYFVLAYVTQNFPQLENIIMFLTEQFAQVECCVTRDTQV